MNCSESSKMPTTEFQERVYAKLRRVPAGKVTTYGDLAAACGTGARAVGQALRCNPYAPDVPCHLVVAADGRIGGFGGEGRGEKIREKVRLLKEEGIEIIAGVIVHFAQVRYRWR